MYAKNICCCIVFNCNYPCYSHKLFSAALYIRSFIIIIKLTGFMPGTVVNTLHNISFYLFLYGQGEGVAAMVAAFI